MARRVLRFHPRDRSSLQSSRARSTATGEEPVGTDAHLLDTDTCISVLRHRPGMVQRLSQLAPTDCAVSMITVYELFCGVERREHDAPVHYPVSCSPQAWASGSLFLMLTSVLGIRPSAPRKELNIINPELPPWLENLHIRNLRIGKSRVGLDFTRRGDRTFCNVVNVEGEKMLVNVAFRH